MPADLPIRCSCGALRGVARGVSGDRGARVICYCDDCQAFAHFLERAAETLDRDGGTDIFGMSSARLEITAGADRLACMRLTPNGLLRWYARCCRTPIGNTFTSRQLPYVGLIHSCVDHSSDGRSRDEVLGPIRARLLTRFAKGSLGQADAHQRAPVSLILRLLRITLAARLRGDHLRSPFFEAATGAPVSPPRVLTAAELAAVRARGSPV
jgi:hypothetical protein